VKQKKYKRPQPPGDITERAAEEWDRICTAIEGLGRQIKPADCSLLETYVRTWNINQAAYRHVQEFGSVVKYSNQIPGQNPFYKNFKETAQLMKTMLDDLGCTPKARDFDTVTDAKPDAGPLVF